MDESGLLKSKSKKGIDLGLERIGFQKKEIKGLDGLLGFWAVDLVVTG